MTPTKKIGMPLLLAALAASVLFPRVDGGAPAATSNPAAPGQTAGTPTDQPSGTEPAQSDLSTPTELLEPFQEFFGPSGVGTAQVGIEALVTRAGESGYELEGMVALVPDPVDSHLAANFDQALDAIQRAHAGHGYLLDRLWLPWSEGEARKKKRYRELPGVLLFRKPGVRKAGAAGTARAAGDEFQEKPRLAAALLVGETPKLGIHKPAFAQALDLVTKLAGTAAGEEVRILGPSFSGSAESLRLALSSERAAKSTGPRFRIVTGSATSPALEATIESGSAQAVQLERAIAGDDRLQEEAFGFFEGKLGWDLSKAALLVEADTAYGQAAGEAGPGRKLVRVPFPSRLSAIRAAWDKGRKDQPQKAPESGGLPFRRPQLAAPSLADESEPVDVVPELSGLTPPASELAIANLLATISREGFRYVGVLATDVRDKLYLIHRVREFCPDAVVFTFDNNLLLAHPQFGVAMDGTIVIGSFPLFTEGAGWLAGVDSAAGGDRESSGKVSGQRFRRQFSSEFQQGIFQAAGRLLQTAPADAPAEPDPPVWITAVGNGSLWPIARLPQSAGETPTGPPEGEPGGFDGFGARLELRLIVIAILIGVLLWALQIVALPAELVTASDGVGRGSWGLLALGTTALWLCGAVLAVVVTVPLWQPLAEGATNGRWERFSSGGHYLLVTLAAYAGLVWMIARMPWPPLPLPEKARRVLWVLSALASALLVAGLALLLHRIWMPGGTELFHLRARKLSSGLSPLVSLALLGGSYYLWALLEIMRRKLLVRHRTEWPIEDLCEPPFFGCGELAREVHRRIEGTLPAAPAWRFWLVLTILLLPMLVSLWQLQPIGDTQVYGRIFLVLLLFAFLLGAISFYRFLTAWWSLHRVLQRLDHTRLAKAFTAISGEVDWNPMKSFGWHIPSFKLQILSARRLKDLVAAGKLDLPWAPQAADRWLAQAFEAEQRGDVRREIEARRELKRIFARASKALEGRTGDADVDAFRALRTIVFLRHVFAHLRNCLMGAIAPGLLLLAAVSAYAFEPKRFLGMMIWTAVLGAVLVTLWVFVQMDRNATLSAIGGTAAGKVSFGRDFFTTVFTYGVVPILGLIAAKVPQAGHMFASWINPLLRVFGTDGGG